MTFEKTFQLSLSDISLDEEQELLEFISARFKILHVSVRKRIHKGGSDS